MVPDENGSVVLPVREYGKMVHASALAGDAGDKAALDIMQQQVAREKHCRGFVTLRLWAGQNMEAPVVDVLGRFKTFGWRLRFVSQGYQELEQHFRCKLQHRPEHITMDYINQIINQYAQQERDNDEQF